MLAAGPDAPSSSEIAGTYELTGALLVLNADFGGGFSQRSAARFSGTGLTVYHRDVLQNGVAGNATDAPLVFIATP